jgi:CubicO group peptidase (beta-lactamase class C family)
MKCRFLHSLLLTIATISAAYSQLQSELTPQQLRLLDSVATQDVPPKAPGIATGIVRNGKIIYQKTAGFANLADSVLITTDSRFNIASNGKQFTALAVLTLIDSRKLKLTDDIRTYLPNLYRTVSSKITIEHLLTHTSGIRDVYDLWSLQGFTWWKNSFSNKDVLSLLEKQEDLNFTPGTKYLYSNTNYILLTAIVEIQTGMSFVDYTNRMFQKLNMPNTAFVNDYRNIRGPIAEAYFNFDRWTTFDWIWNVYGDGNIFSTLADQLQWEQLLQGGKKSSIKKQLLKKSQELTNNATMKNYGYGLEFGTYKGLAYKYHEGATGAWKATVIRFPSKNIAIITLTNTGKATPDNQTRQMADVLLNLKQNSSYFPVKPAQAGNYVSEEEIEGTYVTGSNFTFQFEKRDSAVYLKRIGRNDVKLEREATNIWHQTFDPAFKQEFKRNAKGEMEVTAYYISHAPYSLTKLNNNWEGFNYQVLNGTYLNKETNVKLEIKYTNNKNYQLTIGTQTASNGFLLTPTKLLVDNYILEFDQQSKQPDILLLSGSRIENVKFSRIP